MNMQMIYMYRMSMLNDKSCRYGVEVPKTPKEALDLDSGNGDKFWEESMTLEINQIVNEF